MSTGKKRTPTEREIDQEIIAEGPNAIVFDPKTAAYVPPHKPSSKLISIRLPMNMILQLRAIATESGNMGYQQLIKVYLNEALSARNSFQMQSAHNVFRHDMTGSTGGFAMVSVSSGDRVEPPTNNLEAIRTWKQDSVLSVLGGTYCLSEVSSTVGE